MRLNRLKYLFSLKRLQTCQSLFQNPLLTLYHLSFAGKKPFKITLKDNKFLVFSRNDRKFWNWFFESGQKNLEFTADGEILLEFMEKKLILRPGTFDLVIFDDIYLQDEYSLKKITRKLGNVLDLGGNIGLFTVAILDKAENVVTVEPIPENIRQAKKNILLNGGNPGHLHQFLVSDKSHETRKIFCNTKNSGGHSVEKEWTEKEEVALEVETISLSDLMEMSGFRTVDLLKCDVEGSEYHIFLHTPHEVLKKIRSMVMEVHLSKSCPPENLEKLMAYLEESGYSCSLNGEIPKGPVDGRVIFILKAERIRKCSAKVRAPELTKD